MDQIPPTMVFWTIVAVTLLSGSGAATIAVVAAYSRRSARSLDQVIWALTFVFTSGVGVIFAKLAGQ